MPEETDIAVLKQQRIEDDLRSAKAYDLLQQMQSLLSSQTAQMAAMNKNVAELNHNIDQTCTRLNDMALQGHEARIAATEDWRKETGAKLDTFLAQATKDIATLQATLAVIEQWRKTMFAKVISLMMLSSSVVLVLQKFFAK